jgi:glycosyltransferase involved in cell wall biosynthesis
MNDASVVAIIPLYNGARWIEEAIRSVFPQTLQPDEFIVVDDGSTDNGAGAAIVERLAQERPITLLRKPNGGQSSARNFGVAHSKSTFIAFLDQDDIWYPTHLERLIEPFRQSRTVSLGWVYSNVDTTDECGRLLVRRYLDDLAVERPKRHLVRCLIEDMHVLPGASLISRASFDAVGGFDERLSGYEDDDLFLRLFAVNYDNVYIDEPLSQWRMVASSSGHSPRMMDSGAIYMTKLLDDYPDYSRIIAPRFLRAAVAGYRLDRDRSVRLIQQVSPMLRTAQRILLRMAIPLLRSRLAGPALVAAKPVIERIYRAVFA